MVHAANKFLQICAARKAAKEQGARWPKTKYLLILLLIRFPFLRESRKKYLAAKREADTARRALNDAKRRRKEMGGKEEGEQMHDDDTMLWMARHADLMEQSIFDMEVKLQS